MWRKSLFICGAAVLSTAGLLLVVGPTLAGGLGQGQNLYQWSGGGLGGSTQSGYAVPYSAPVVARGGLPVVLQPPGDGLPIVLQPPGDGLPVVLLRAAGQRERLERPHPDAGPGRCADLVR